MNISKEELLREEYVSRINKVQDYIDSNISEEFSLATLSGVANFSPYHFHRVFYAMTGETLFQYIQRIRLEKAAFMLLANRKAAVTDIALECGFSNQASFAKAFKKYFNMSATGFRESFRQRDEKPEEITESNMGKVLNEIVCYNCTIRNMQELGSGRYTHIPYSVEVKSIPEMKAVYIRHTGPYKKNNALFDSIFLRLFLWADSRQLIHPEKTKWLTLYHDTVDITSEDKLRISVCMTVEGKVEVSGEIGSLSIPGGKYAVGHFEIFDYQYQEAWNAMFAEWLPGSRYQPDDRLCFELYHEGDQEEPHKHIVDIYIPVRPL